MHSGHPNPMSFPARAAQNGVQPMEMQNQSPKHLLQHGAGAPSKIPVFSAGKHFDEATKKTSFSAPTRTSALPQIVSNSLVSDGKGGSNSRGHSNPEKNKKYAQNPR